MARARALRSNVGHCSTRAWRADVFQAFASFSRLGACIQDGGWQNNRAAMDVVLVRLPNYGRLREVHARIRSVTSDLGGEFHIRDAPDLLVPYLQAKGVRLPPFEAPQQWLLPSALASPGWHHMFDALLRFGLCQVRWFAAWLDLSKALTKWLRNFNGEIVDSLMRINKLGAAALVRNLKTENFEKWRWKTLALVMFSFANLCCCTP